MSPGWKCVFLLLFFWFVFNASRTSLKYLRHDHITDSMAINKSVTSVDIKECVSCFFMWFLGRSSSKAQSVPSHSTPTFWLFPRSLFLDWGQVKKAWAMLEFKITHVEPSSVLMMKDQFCLLSYSVNIVFHCFYWWSDKKLHMAVTEGSPENILQFPRTAEQEMKLKLVFQPRDRSCQSGFAFYLNLIYIDEN